ncbi:ph domain-containing protein [Ophiostoma piceae UAMH 11346]|uniref:Ph domain-containing protein n=1 Tax=Ophiostoma piceae (strain UAMH 11346) TaxID=1262450 RepID=S3BQB0_OPHP1|nr:ph domain-containing protein [Ophiostoma piceae UAMH 11346]
MADTASGTPVPKPLTVPAATAVPGNGPASPVPPMPSSTPLAANFPAGSGAALSPDSAPRSSIAVGLHEAALDSPSFRASAVLFCEQVDSLERWLESYAKSTTKLVHDFAGLEDSINNYLAKIVPPPGTADGLIDSDHTLLALKRVSDGTRDWWSQVTYALRRLDTCNAEPIRNFLNAELRSFKETRRATEQSQKTYDTTLARYVSQSKAKEPSALREDAFAVYETRRAYLKASMDFCQMAPQLRSSLDKLLTRVSADFWRDMKRARVTAANSTKWGEEMERIRGWAKDIELSEGTLRRELQYSRRVIGETTLAVIKPSRELDDYSTSTVPYLGSRGPSTVRPGQGQGKAFISEKQGWLFLRTVTGKPARVNWVRRWYYCRDGIFGYLVQGPQGVLQGDDIGVLLCSAKPAVQEDRRFCFEVKTKSHNLILQAETQGQLTEWIEVFEVAKRKAFEASMTRDNASSPIGGMDPAFSITPPSVPDFSARALDAAPLGTVEEGSVPQTLAQSNTLPIPGAGPDGGLMSRSSFDVGAGPPRRSITTLGQELKREEGESRGEHASRIMQRLDLHRKATFGGGAAGNDPFGPGGNGGGNGGAPASAAASGQTGNGIASLISSTHGTQPKYQQNQSPSGAAGGPIPAAQRPHMPPLALGDSRRGCLAPTTYAKAPIMTFLSKVAVNVSSERSLCRPGNFGSLPSGILANYWGSQQWGSGFVSRGHGGSSQDLHTFETVGGGIPHSPSSPNPGAPAAAIGGAGTPTGHRKTLSVDAAKIPDPRGANFLTPEVFPVSYPTELRAQHAQFRLLFPSVPLHEKLVLVFNAAWSSASESGTENQSLIGSGRIYVTPDNMYFYSQTMGLVVTYAVSLDIITEVTSAPGKDCDYTFLHLGQDMNETGFTRITIKTFLEDMYILQARLNLLIDDLQAAEPMEVSDILVALHNIVGEDNGRRSPSIGGWDQYSGLGGSAGSPPYDDNGTPTGRHSGRNRQLSNDAGIGGRRVTSHGSRGSGMRPFPAFPTKLQLPSHPIVYEPTDMQKKVAERHFEISAKACFHVLFGDKSFIFPKLYFERQAHNIEQGPWTLADQGKMKRQFLFKAETVDIIGRKKEEAVSDEQTIDVFSDHVTYVVTYVKTAWHLPHSQAFKQITKVVITHVAKSKCKLAVFVKVNWSKAPAFSKNIIERQALDDASRDAEELAEIATDEVRKLGAHSRTKRAIQVYGNIGAQPKAVIFSPGEHGVGSSSSKQVRATPRTLTDMVLETVRSFMESVITSLVMWTFAACRKLFHVASAQRLLLAVLALSIVTNLAFSSRETSAWWTERHAAKYMGKLGVGPNVAMSKSIYLADLEAASHAVAPRAPPATPDSVCYDTFLSIANATDLNSRYEDAGELLLLPASRATASRLRRTRQKLASYRHDLVVAMRVVNSVEREMVQSEWENWLDDETYRCDQVHEMLLRQGRDNGSGDGSGDGNGDDSSAAVVSERLALLAHWHKDYCGSCEADQRALEDLAWRQSMV